MMSASGGAGSELSALLSLLSDPERVAARLEELRLAEEAHSRSAAEFASSKAAHDEAVALSRGVEEALERQRADLAAERGEIVSLRDALNQDIAAFENLRTETDMALSAREADVSAREKSVSDRERVVVGRESALDAREKEVAAVEARIARKLAVLSE
jgi:hypothetical protein